MIVTDFEKCTGCGACVQACPKQCIHWQSGAFDFRYPQVDQAACIGCGACDRACPIDIKREKSTVQHVYAAIHNDSEILRQSTSGGAFSSIADHVLRQGGVVYGCSWEPGMQVQHIRVQDKVELAKLRGSKYVQSDTKNCFVQAREDLLQGKQVLFSGTPCQIAGLRTFLGREYDNLWTVDVICHGVGSQAYFDKYLTYTEKRLGSVSELHFRDKRYAGWAIGGAIVAGGKTKPYYDYNHYYYFYFLRGDIYRSSCYQCAYAGTNRPSDFTIADFWGVEAIGIDLDTENGCSLLMANNEKADRLLRALPNLTLREVRIEQAVRMNAQLQHPSKPSPVRDALEMQYRTMTAEKIQSHFRRNNRRRIALLRLKAAVPYRIRRFLRKWQ